MNVGDRVIVRDQSQMISMSTPYFDVYPPPTAVYEIIDKREHNSNAVHRNGSPLHDIIIKDIETQEIYLHSLAYVKSISVKIVKDPVELMETLIAQGYAPESDGRWRSFCGPAFNPAMWAYCGKAPCKNHAWRDEWLKQK